VPIFLSLFSTIGGVLKGFFGWKQGQTEVVAAAVKVFGDVSASNAQREQAIAQIISAEAQAGGLAANWRPLLMLLFMALLLSFWFGYTPPNISGPMPPMIQEVFDIIKIGIGGYIPARTVEKIVSQLNLASVLKTMLNGKK
jgi:hypothetical protein